MPEAALPTHPARWAIALWGVGGVCWILIDPILRLSKHAVEAFEHGLDPLQWAVAAVWIGFMVYTEGYRGFHLRFSPRVVVRAFALAQSPRPISVILAPLTCMGLLDATRKRLVVSWALIAMIVVLVVGVRQLHQPWRGIVDMGVVLGLSIGLASIVWHLVQALRGAMPEIPSDLGRRLPTTENHREPQSSG